MRLAMLSEVAVVQRLKNAAAPTREVVEGEGLEVMEGEGLVFISVPRSLSLCVFRYVSASDDLSPSVCYSVSVFLSMCLAFVMLSILARKREKRRTKKTDRA